MIEISKILLVDDKEANLFALRDTLKEVDAEIISVSCGNEALKITLHHDFALIILDVHMPGMNGYELAELLRGKKETRQIPIIFLSAIDSAEYAATKGFKTGAVDFLEKPLNPHVLINKVFTFVRMDQQQRELKKTAAELKRSNRDLEEFAYISSHDLQEPLRKIQSFGDILSEDYADRLGEQGKDYLDRMLKAAARMQNLIQDLLEYSRASVSAEQLSKVDLQQIAEGVISDLALKINQFDARIEIENLPVVDADESQMRQLIQNLLDNALKFHRKDVLPVIKVYGSQNGVETNETAVTEFTIEDNGIGFDEQYLSRRFGIYQRLHSRSEYEGAGIGLALCRKIAENLSGSITAKSTPGEGAAFVVSLPKVRRAGNQL